MKRTSLLLLLSLVLAIVAAGCNKPSDAACRKAIANMRSLMGTDGPTSNTDVEGDIRRCKGGSTKKAVDCAGNALTLDDLRACDFMKIPARSTGSATTGSGSATGSATGSAPGSAAGSAGSSAGSAPGSAGGSGSASGSAGATPGSAAGSAAG
nr:hypothetical protein [Myxococcota bacterium]